MRRLLPFFRLALLVWPLMLGLAASPALAQTTNWTDGIGDWFVPGNWSAGVPTSATNTTTVGNGGQAEVFAPGANAGNNLVIGGGSAVFVDPGGSLTAGNVINNSSLFINKNAAVNLSGTFSGTGTTTLNGGTLRAATTSTENADLTFFTLSTSTVSAAAGQTLTVNGGLILNSGSTARIGSAADTGSVTLGGTASGSGSVEVVAGTTVVTGASAIGGTVTIDSGATMQWGNGNGAFLVGGGNAVANNGALVMNFGSSSIAGPVAISGTGSVTLQSGLFNESGAATYTGPTTIDSAGLFRLTGTGSIASSSNVANNGTFDISGTTAGASITTLNGSGGVSLGGQTLTLTNASGIFSGVMADGGTGGGLTIAAGTETLTGTNTYTGPTTINPGATLVLGHGGTTGSVAGSIVDNGLVQFNYSGPVTAPNTFSGTGSAEVVAGTAVVTGASAIGGTVTIDPGATMQWGNGTSGAFLVGGGNAVVDNGALVMNFGGGGIAGSLPISGTGSLTIQSGSLNDSGVSSYTGATTIDAAGLLLLSGGGSISNSSNVVNNGTFDISGTTAGTSITTLNGSGLVSLGGQTLTLSAANGIFSGVIADGGSSGGTGGGLTIAAGTETLTGTNTYTGPTTINVGATLVLGGGGTTGTVAGNVVDNGLVQFNYSGPVTSVNTFSGTGSAEVVAGTAVIIGASAIGGTVTIDSGATMQWGNGTSGAFLVGGGNAVVDNGALVMNFGGGGIAGSLPISGTGSMEMQSGSFNESGAATYTGPTRIDAAGLLLLTGGGSISNSSNVINNGIFDISGTTAGTSITTLTGSGQVSLGAQTLTLTAANGVFSGVIQDAGFFAGTGGGLTIAAGTETLSGTNTYTGGTTINPGATLVLGNGGTTGSVAGNIVDNGTLAFNRSNLDIFGGVISGAGSLLQNGSGTTVLTNTNTYTGATTVNAGTLEVDGSIANSSSVTVNAGGRLSGTGIVDPATTTITSGGTLAPGNAANPTGTLTITGNLAFQSGAIYLVQVTPSAAARTNVAGSATLAGTVQANLASGSYTNKSYDILHSAGLGGTTFNTLVFSNPNFNGSLSYTATDVFLNLTANLGAGTTLNQNQQNVANAINNVFNAGGTLPANFTNIFGLTGGALANTLSALDGEVATGAERAAFQLDNQFLTLMLDPFVNGRGNASFGGAAVSFAPERETELPPEIALAYASILTKAPPRTFEQRWSAWGSAYGGSNTTNGDPVVGSNNVRTNTFGFAGGMDYHFTPYTVAGFALAGAGTNWGLANAMGTGRSDALQVGAYGTHWFGPAYVAGALAFSNHWFTTNRSALGDTLTANFTGQNFGARVEGGYRYWALPAFAVTPYGAVQAQTFHTPAYSETDVTGGGFGLNNAAQNASDVRTELGARFDDPAVVYGKPLILFGRLAWAHDFVSNPALSAAFQALPGGTFTVNGAPIPRDSALTTAGAQLFLTPNWTLLAKFEGEFASGSQTYAGTGTLRYSW